MTAMPQAALIMPVSSAESMDASVPQNGREARNLAEKHRRDKLNASIQELATMVPHVADATRRLDKTAVLRFATHGLRLQYVFGKSVKNQCCNDHKSNIDERMQQFSQPELTNKLMELLNSFLITLTCHGQIVLVSENIEQLLGHCQSDLYGQNILQITHPEDQANLRQQLIPKDMESIFRNNYNDGLIKSEEDEMCYSDDDDDSTGYHTSNSPTEIDERLRSDRRCFIVRLARAGTRSETTRNYELVKIDGCFRRSDCSTAAGSFPIVSQFIRRSRCNSGSSCSGTNLQHEAITQAALHGISGNDIVLVAMARVIRPQRVINRLLNANHLEYQTRHLIDGRIIDCDQRIGIVAGYMKDEVRNLSPFSFMHQDDVRWVIVALRQMYDCNSDYGESCYRLLSRNGHFIYLQTRGFLEIDKNTNKVHSFVCINTLLDEEEGRRKVQEMKNKFSIIIKTKIPSNSLQDVPASQNPQQLERIVLYLIKNLQKRNDDAAVTEDIMETSNANGNQGRSTKTPPIALVPPEPASVRNSISKSVDVVNVTVAKNLHYSQKNEAMLSPTANREQQTNNVVQHKEQLITPEQQRPTVLKMYTSSMSPSSSLSSSSSSSPSPDVKRNRTPDTDGVSDISSLSSAIQSPQTAQATSTNTTDLLQRKISVLKRLHSPVSTCSEDSISPAKRRESDNSEDAETPRRLSAATEVHTVITTSLKKLNHSLNTIDNNARLLREHRVHFTNSQSLDGELGAIYVEHKKQREILVNIQTEYDTHLQQQQH